MANAPTHAIVHWEDKIVSVISLASIVHPRKQLDLYNEGEYIDAPYGTTGIWRARISEIGGK